MEVQKESRLTPQETSYFASNLDEKSISQVRERYRFSDYLIDPKAFYRCAHHGICTTIYQCLRSQEKTTWADAHRRVGEVFLSKNN